MAQCLFCSISAGDIPADIVRETDRVVVFRDINPQAPAHMLAIPREHYANAAELAAADLNLAGELLALLTQVAAAEGLEDGHRIVFNSGSNGGQTVGHVHAHLLGGRQLSWPPG